MLRCYKLTPLSAKKQFENNKQHTFTCIDHIGSLAEGRNALVTRTNHSEGGCSNLTPVMPHCYRKFYLPKDSSKIINNVPITVVTVLAG